MKVAEVALNLADVIFKAREFLTRLTNREFNGVTSISKEDDGWKVTLELIERKSIPDSSDILGIYEMKLDEGGEVLAFNRVKLRRRGDTEKLGTEI